MKQLRSSAKRIKTRNVFFFTDCAFLFQFIIFLILFFVVNNLKKEVGQGIFNLILGFLTYSIVVLIVSVIITIILCIRPFFEIYEVGVDAHGKKYAVANNINWFIENLSEEQKNNILIRIKEIEDWRDKELLLIKEEKKKEKFLVKYKEHASTAFYFFIYRSGTRYTQRNYIKTPYIANTEYWSNYYSIDSVKSLLCDFKQKNNDDIRKIVITLKRK